MGKEQDSRDYYIGQQMKNNKIRLPYCTVGKSKLWTVRINSFEVKYNGMIYAVRHRLHTYTFYAQYSSTSLQHLATEWTDIQKCYALLGNFIFCLFVCLLE